MSPLDLSSVEDGQQRLEAVVKAKESSRDLKAKLAGYRQTYISEVNFHKTGLGTAADSFVSPDAKSFLEASAKSLGDAVVNLAAEGENLQKKGQPKEGDQKSTDKKETSKPAEKLDFSTLANLKAQIASELSAQKSELNTWKQIEKIGGDFEKLWNQYKKEAEQAPTPAGLAGTLVSTKLRQAGLEQLKTKYEAIAPTASAKTAHAEDLRFMSSDIESVKSDVANGQALVDIQTSLNLQKTELSGIETRLAGRKTLTPQEYQDFLSTLNIKSGSLKTQLDALDATESGGGRFRDLVARINTASYQPVSDKLNRLHGMLEGRKPQEPQDTDAKTEKTPAETEHEFRVFAMRSTTELSAIDRRVTAMEKELEASRKDPSVWTSRANYEDLLSRIQSEIDGSNSIDKNILEWGSIEARSAEANDFRINKCRPVVNRAELLKTRVEASRGTDVEKNEKEILNKKVREMVGQLESEWTEQQKNQQYVQISEKLQGLAEDTPEFKGLTDNQDKLYTFVLNFEIKVGFFLTKPDDLDSTLVTEIKALLEKGQLWKQQITGDRALYQSRKAAKEQPDQKNVIPAVYEEEWVKDGEGGTMVQRLVSPERTDVYAFNEYIDFVNALDTNNEKVNEGRGWVWKGDSGKLPDKVKSAFSAQADIIVQTQKEAAAEKSKTEEDKIKKEQLLTTKGREVLGKEAEQYFKATDLLAEGKIDEAMSAYAEYLKAAESFTPEQTELHQSCIEDARKQIESNKQFPEFMQALKLQKEGKIDEAIKIFRIFLDKLNAQFPAMTGENVGPTNPERAKYAEQMNVALDIIRQYNSDKLKMLDELSKDFIYLQTVDTARRSPKVVNPLDFANLKGAAREMMLPYIPAQYLTPAEQKRQAENGGGLQGGEIQEIKTALEKLKAKIAQGDPPVNFEAEYAKIKEKLKHNTEKQPGGTDWQDPNTGEYVANSPSSRIMAFFDQINSSDPKVREKGFVAIAGEFKDQEVGMRYTQKYLRQAMVSRYRAFAETADGKATETELRKQLAADPSINAEIVGNARELYKRWAAEQEPPLPADPVNAIIFQSFEKRIADSIFEDRYEREMRKKMTEKGQFALAAAEKLFAETPNRPTKTVVNRWGARSIPIPFSELSLADQQEWLGKVQNGDLGVAILPGGALKEYNWSRPYDEANATWIKPWSWEDYNEDDYNDFKAKAAEITVQTLATLPVGWAAGTIGRAAGMGAVRLLMREAIVEGAGRAISMEAAEATINALSRGGVRALMAEKIVVDGVERALWSTLSSGMKARVLMNYGAGIVVEGVSLAVMNGVWEGMYSGRSELFDSLDGGKYGKAGGALLENIAKAGLFRGVGAGQGAISGMAAPGSRLLTKIMAEVGGEAVSGAGGAGVEALFMMMHDQGKEITWEWFAQSMLQNAASAAAMHAGREGVKMPEMGFMKGSAKRTRLAMTEAELSVNRTRLAELGITRPADITSARIDHSTGEIMVRLAGREEPVNIPRERLPFEKLPPELQRSLYERDRSARESLAVTLHESGLDSPINWMRMDADGNVISSTGHIVPIGDPGILPPNLQEKHRQLMRRRNEAGPYRAPATVEPAPPAKPVATETAPTQPKPEPRPAPEIPPRTLESGEAAKRLAKIKPELDLLARRESLSKDPASNAEAIAKIDAEIATRARERNLSPDQYRFNIETEGKIHEGLAALDRGETNLYNESKIIKKPVLDEHGKQKIGTDGQPVYETVNLFAGFDSKSSAYSREMLRSLNYEQLAAEGGGKIIKIGGDELVVYHAGPDGTVQKLFIDISNMGPTNDTATAINGSKVNLVDIYLHRVSEAVLAQSKARKGQLLDPAAFNAEVARVADSLFNLDRGPDGQPLKAEDARARFEKLQAEWGLEGTFADYQVNMQSMRILAEYRADTRTLDASYKQHPGVSFGEHIASEIQSMSGLSIPELQKLIASNPKAFQLAFADRLPKSGKLKAMKPEEVMAEIAKLDPAKSKPEDLMMLYALMARVDVATLSTNPALKPLTDRLSTARTEMVGDPPHPRVETPRLMDAKVVSIALPPELAKALSALAETDPVRAHAILAAARQFAEKPLDAQKYSKSKTPTFAEFNIMEFVEMRNGKIQIKETAKEFRDAVETSERDKKIGNVVDTEDALRSARANLEQLSKQLADGTIDQETFRQRVKEAEQKITDLQDKLSIDPDTGAFGQGYMDISPTRMFSFGKETIPAQYRVWNSAVTELGHSGVINAKYGYQAMDGIMSDYFQVLQSGIAAELPPDLQHFKIMRSGGGKFEVVFLDARAVKHLADKGLTPASLVERLARGPGQAAVDKVLRADAAKLAASQSDAAVRNSQFRYNKGTEMIEVGHLTARAETNIGQERIARAQREKPQASSREIIATGRTSGEAAERVSAERVSKAEETMTQARGKVDEVQRQIDQAKADGKDTKDLEKAMKSAKKKLGEAEQNLDHERLSKTVSDRNPDIDTNLIDEVLRNHPEFTAEQLAKRSLEQLKQLIEATKKADTIKSELDHMSTDELRDYVDRYNKEHPQEALLQQEFQVLRVTAEGVIMVDQHGKLVEKAITKENALDVLREVKSLDANIKGQSYKLRSECLKRSGGAISSDAAYTYGEVPSGKAQDAYLDNRDNWLPERQQLHDLILSAEFEKAKALSERLGDQEPTIYALRGNTAAGKTTRLRKDRDFARTGDTSGAINPDTYKAQLRTANSKIDYSPTAYQVHEEGSMLARRLTRQIEAARPPLSEMSMVIDKRLNKTKNIAELIATAERLDRPVKILDVDSPLETSCQRVLTRAIAGEDPAVPFGAVAEGFEGIRQNRAELIEQVKNNPAIKEYVLYVTDENGQSVKAAEKRNGAFKILDQALYERAINGNTEEAVDKVRATKIDDAYILAADEYFRPFLERYKGKTLGEALDAHSKLTVEPHDQAFYMRAAMENLGKTSRTAQGVVDTSASTDKAAKMAEGLTDAEAAEVAKANYQKVMQRLFAERSKPFTSPDEVRVFVESVGREINAGIVKEGVLLRAGEDSKKYPYTKIADLPKALEQFYQEFFQRVNDPHQDPVELAAWVEYRVNLSDHIFADGCGKSSLALVSFVLMRYNLPLPQYQAKMDTIRHSPKTIRGVDPAADAKAVRDLAATLRRRMAGKKD